MADEQLRLVASLKDNASAGVRRIGRELKGVRVEPGMAQAQKWIRTFNGDVADFKAQTARVGGILTSMGVGGLAAAGSIGAMVAQFKALSDHILDVKELGREIGVTTAELRAMERAGQHFGLDPSKMDAALKRLAGMMPILRRGGNNELTDALVRRPDILRKVKGEADDIGAVFKDVVGYFNQLQNPQDRIKYFEQVFGDGDLEKLNAEGTGGFQKQLEAARKAVEPITKEAEAQAQALRDAMIDFNASIERLELKVAPAVFKGMKQSADDFRQAFGVIEEAYNWYKANKDHPVEAASKSFADAVHDRRLENERNPNGIVFDLPGAADRALETIMGKKALGRDEFAPAKDAGEAAARVIKMQAELAALEAKLRADRNPVGFPVREADTIARVRELRDAIGTLQPAQVPSVAPLPPPRPPAAAFRVPSRYDAEMRARGPGDGRDHTADGVVVGVLAPDVIHLRGTLRTMARQAEDGPVHQAAFHPAGLNTAASLDPVATIAAGTKEGVLGALRELQGVGGADGSTARGGMMPVSFGGGGGSGGASGGNPALGGGFGGGGGSYGNPSKSLLDFIAQSEGGGYNISYGNGKYLPGGHEQDLTGKTLNDILALGRGMIAKSGSSAMGRYMITGDTIRDLMKRMHLSGSEKYDEKMQDAMASRLLADEGLRALSRWEALKRGNRMSTAMGLLKSGQIVSQPAQEGADGGGFTGKGDAVGIATSMLGFGERQSAQALGHIMHAGEWCADFVNGVIEKSGGKGTGSGMADSFKRWGRHVDMQDARRGDVIMENDGPGTRIHHAGLVESVDRDKAGKVTGIHMISGNYGHMVRRNLERFRYINELRRGNESGASALQGAAAELRDAAVRQREASLDQRGAARTMARVPDWHDPGRADLGVESRKAAMQEHRIAGGVDAHIHVHDGQVRSARASATGHVRDARITVRTAPQRTFTV